MSILIQGVRIVDKFKDIVKDVFIEDDKIKYIDDDLYIKLNINKINDCKIIKADKLVLMPGFIDTHAHFRDPGFTYKEDILSGSLAAINGGYTFVNLMANTNPICDSREVLDFINDKVKSLNLIGINQSMALTKNLAGKELIDFDTLSDEEFVLSDDGKDLLSNKMMLEACKKAKQKNKLIMVHAEDSEISPYNYRIAEDLITLRDVYLSGKTGCHIHMSHVSTKDSIDAIREGKNKGYNITCEVTPHHISLYDFDYRVNPPIRKKEDVCSIIEAIKDGVVDSIGTDHAPHSHEDKIGGAPGMVGIETAFSICNTYLVKSGNISLSRLSDIMSYGGAKILRKNNMGVIKEGYYADLVLVDPNEEIVYNERHLLSKSKNTPFLGKKLYGRVIKTIVGGRILKDDN